jgi:hypothetical protein
MKANIGTIDRSLRIVAGGSNWLVWLLSAAR